MLEVVLIMSIVYAIMYMPLRGKTFEQLSEAQKQRVRNQHFRYMQTKKGRQTPDMTVEQYLPTLQKTGITYLIIAICLLPIYIAALILLYPSLLGA